MLASSPLILLLALGGAPPSGLTLEMPEGTVPCPRAAVLDALASEFARAGASATVGGDAGAALRLRVEQLGDGRTLQLECHGRTGRAVVGQLTLPSNATEVPTHLALLARNLCEDQAGELLADLFPEQPPAPPPVEPPPDAPPVLPSGPVTTAPSVRARQGPSRSLAPESRWWLGAGLGGGVALRGAPWHQRFELLLSWHRSALSLQTTTFAQRSSDWMGAGGLLGAELSQPVSSTVRLGLGLGAGPFFGATFQEPDVPAEGATASNWLVGNVRLHALVAWRFRPDVDWVLSGLAETMGEPERPRLTLSAGVRWGLR